MSNKFPADSMPSTLPPHQQPQPVAQVNGQMLTVSDLRSVLFDAINGIKGGTMRIEQAKMISDLSQVIINSAKVEVEFVKATGGKAKGSGFMDKPGLTFESGEPPAAPASPAAPAAVGATGLTAEAVAPGVTRYQASDEERSRT